VATPNASNARPGLRFAASVFEAAEGAQAVAGGGLDRPHPRLPVSA
jgi:hypothetical protein